MDFFMSETCEKGFKTEKCTQHPGKKLFGCETCNKEIIGNIKLQKNIFTHITEKPFICDVCGKDFAQKINLMMHMCVHTLKIPFQYEKNNAKETKRDNDLENMLIPANVELHSCLICEQEFTDKSIFLQHTCNLKKPVQYEKNNVEETKLFENMSIPANAKLHECLICEQGFTDKNEFLQHKCNIKEPFQYEKNNAKETKNDNVLENMLIPANNELHNCLICEQEFTDKSIFLQHTCNLKKNVQYEKNNAEETKLFENMLIPANAELHECLICEQGFTDKNKFLQHKCDIKPPFQYEQNNAKETKNDNLFENRLIPLNIELHECLICERGFTNTNKFHQHKCNIKEPFQFKKHNAKVAKSGNLLKNMLIPANIELHNCPNCKLEFTDKSKFHRHMRTHTGERPYKCTLCPKEFSQSYTLVRHMRTHTGEKPFGCYVCGRRFNQSGALRQHVRIHTGEKPYHCSICDKRFTSNGNLVHHVRVHTKD